MQSVEVTATWLVATRLDPDKWPFAASIVEEEEVVVVVGKHLYAH